MKYVSMSIEEAAKLFHGKNVTVLVATQDLDDEKYCLSFTKKDGQECEKIIRNAETIAKACDDFVNQLKIFSHEQKDLLNIEPIGQLSTILLPEKLE